MSAEKNFTQKQSLMCAIVGVLIVFGIFVFNKIFLFSDNYGWLDSIMVALGLFFILLGSMFGDFSLKKKLFFIILLGLSVRIISFSYNQVVHADIIGYALAVENLGCGGNWWISNWIWTPGQPSGPTSGFVYPAGAIGGYLIPSAITFFVGYGYLALKLFSLVSGVVLIFVIFNFSRNFFDEEVALYSSILVAFSLPLIDYSANGSVYAFNLVVISLLLLFLSKKSSKKNDLLVGLIAGSALFFHNYLIILPAAFLLVFGGALLLRKTWVRDNKLIWGGFFTGFVLTTLFTYFMLGSIPVLNMVVSTTKNDIIFEVDKSPEKILEYQSIDPKTTLTFRNLIGGVRSLSILLTSLLIPFLVYGLYTAKDTFKGGGNPHFFWMVFFMLVVYIFIFFYWSAWSNSNIRYLLFPLMIAYLPVSVGLKNSPKVLRLSVIYVIIASSLISINIPPHTYYYGHFENSYLEKQPQLSDASTYIVSQERGAILSLMRQLDGGIRVFYETRYPFLLGYKNVLGGKTVYEERSMDIEQVNKLVEEYDVEYLLVNKREWAPIPKNFKLAYKKDAIRVYKRE